MLNEKIVYYRKKNMLTQEELAYQLNVSRQTVTKWETGTIYPNIEYLIKLSNLFGVSIDYLVKEDDCFVIKGQLVEKLFKMTKVENEEALNRFLRKLTRMGVDTELEKLGIKEDDQVRILDFYFNYKV